MRTRLISAAILVPVVALVFWAGNPFILLATVFLAALAAFEVVQLVRRAGLPANTVMSVVLSPLVVLGFLFFALPRGTMFEDNSWIYLAPALALVLVGTATLSLVFTDPRTGFTAWVGNVIAVLYSSLIGFAAGISSFGYSTVPADNLKEMFGAGRVWLVILVLTVWTLDSAAYVVGRYFPRGNFFTHISPKKTWSGAIGGTVAAVMVCGAFAAVLLEVNVVLGAITGLLIAVSAQAGDLVESMLKRAAGAKDSGTLIPGHGGVLDRIDSFLFAAPVAYAWLLVLMRNGVIGV